MDLAPNQKLAFGILKRLKGEAIIEAANYFGMNESQCEARRCYANNTASITEGAEPLRSRPPAPRRQTTSWTPRPLSRYGRPGLSVAGPLHATATSATCKLPHI